MKEKLKNPFVIINTFLIIFVGVMVLNANADRLRLPRPVKQALAAVASIAGSGNTDRIAAFAAVNQIGDSIMWQNGSSIVVDGELCANNISCSLFPSDQRLKKNIVPLTSVLGKIEQIEGVSFEWNSLAKSFGHKLGQKDIGLIAQNVREFFPELVTTASSSDNQLYLNIKYPQFTAVLLQAVKELKAENDLKTAVLKELTGRVEMLAEEIKLLKGE